MNSYPHAHIYIYIMLLKATFYSSQNFTWFFKPLVKCNVDSKGRMLGLNVVCVHKLNSQKLKTKNKMVTKQVLISET